MGLLNDKEIELLPKEFKESINRVLGSYDREKAEFGWNYIIQFRSWCSTGFICTIVGEHGGCWVTYHNEDVTIKTFSPNMIEETYNLFMEVGRIEK